jgi:hypothetical protein
MRLVVVLVVALGSLSLNAQSGPTGEILFQSDREGPTRLFILDVAKAQQ